MTGPPSGWRKGGFSIEGDHSLQGAPQIPEKDLERIMLLHLELSALHRKESHN